MVQYSEHQRNKRSNKAEMKEPDKAADNVFSFEKCHFNFILDSRTKEDCFYFFFIHHQTVW